MVTPGGEVAFVGRMIEESMQLRSGIRWYTSMVLAPPPPPPPPVPVFPLFRHSCSPAVLCQYY